MVIGTSLTRYLLTGTLIADTPNNSTHQTVLSIPACPLILGPHPCATTTTIVCNSWTCWIPNERFIKQHFIPGFGDAGSPAIEATKRHFLLCSPTSGLSVRILPYPHNHFQATGITISSFDVSPRFSLDPVVLPLGLTCYSLSVSTTVPSTRSTQWHATLLIFSWLKNFAPALIMLRVMCGRTRAETEWTTNLPLSAILCC
jgi:hypothetical protein